MKILHIINSLDAGGAQKLVEDLVPLMNQYANFELEVLLLDGQNCVFDKKIIESGVKINVIPTNNIRNPFNILHIRKHIISGEHDLVHVHLFPTNYWASIASKLIFKDKPKLVITEHSTHNKRRDKWFFKYIDRFIYSSFDNIISISEKTQENLISWLNPQEAKLKEFTVIENGIDVKFFKKSEPYLKSKISQKFKENTRLICMVGRFSIQKDQSTLIRAMKGLPEDVHLLLVGEGLLREQSENLTNELGLIDRVYYLGFRDDVHRLLKTCDIVVLSSHWEGFGLAAVEGMAAGKPVVASDVPGLREVVQGAGILFAKGNHQELTAILNKLISDKDYYDTVARECTLRAELFNIDVMVKEYVELYQSNLC